MVKVNLLSATITKARAYERTTIECLPNRRAKYYHEMVVSMNEIKILAFEKIHLLKLNVIEFNY